MGELKLQENYTFVLKYIVEGKEHTFPCHDAKILIGSSDYCDITIKQDGIRDFHCVVLKQNESLAIFNLDENVNFSIRGQSAKSAILGYKDTFKAAEVKFSIDSMVAETLPSIPRSSNSHSSNLISIHNKPNESRKLENQIYVDGEYVDGKMDESSYKRSSELLIDQGIIRADNFIPADLGDVFDLHLGKEALTSQQALDVIFTSYGNILSYDSVPLDGIKDYKKYLSEEVLSYVGSEINDGLIQGTRNELKINECGGLSFSKDSDEMISEVGDMVILEKGVNQIFFRLGRKVLPAQSISSNTRDRKQYLMMLSLIFVLFLPTLLLRLVDTEVVEPEKEVVIIYKPKKKIKPEKLVQKSDDKKDIDKTAKKEAKKVSENKSENTKTKKVNKISNSKKSAPKKKSVKASAKAKTQKVAFASSFSKLVGSSSVKSKSFEKNSKSTGSNLGNLTTSKSGSLSTVGGGSSVAGLATSSQFGSGKGFKSKGAAKRGFDSKFTSKRTVVLGALDPAIIDRILREHLPEFRYCYQQELVKNSSTSGKITMDFTIGSGGRVSKSNIKGKFSSGGSGCVKRVLSKIQFPQPKGGGVVQVKKPLTFSANKTSL